MVRVCSKCETIALSIVMSPKFEDELIKVLLILCDHDVSKCIRYITQATVDYQKIKDASKGEAHES